MGHAQALAGTTRYETQGLSGGVGITVTAGTSSTKGSYTTLGTTGFEYDGFHLYITGLPGAGFGRYRIDLATNTGSANELIVEDVYFDPSGPDLYYADHKAWFVPVRVPSGASLLARAQGTYSSAESLAISVLGFSGDAKAVRGFRALKSATDWTNTDPTNSITLTGTSLTGWVQVMASTPVRFAGLCTTIDTLGTVSPTLAHAVFEIGLGSLGSEHSTGIKIAAQLGGGASSVSGSLVGNQFGPFPCDIPVSSRLVVRAQCDAANTNSYGVVLNGLAA